MKFTSKPITIEAVQWTGDNAKEIAAWFKTHNKSLDLKVWIRRQSATKSQWLYVSEDTDWGTDPEYTAAVYDTLHKTWVGVKDEQWIICGTKGEFYPCDPEVFETKYGPELEDAPTEDDEEPDTDEPLPYFDEFLAGAVAGLRSSFNYYVTRLVEKARMETVDAVNKMEGTQHEVTLSDEVGTSNHLDERVGEEADNDVTDLIRGAMDEARNEAANSPIIQQAKGKK